jgi:4'-phosphopantetheinyl transferase
MRHARHAATAALATRRSRPPDVLRLDGSVDLWFTSLHPLADPDAAMALLDRGERARAERFRFPLDRERYIARHAFLRRTLGWYLGMPPDAVRFTTTELGRPELDVGWGLDFSASHSDGRAVVAVTRGARVGVDIERLRRLDDALDLMEGNLTDREASWLRAASTTSRSRVFLQLWTRKEAVVKAIGTGLSLPLDSFDTGVPGADGVMHPVGLVGIPAMSMIELDGLEGCIAAVAVQAEHVTVHHRTHSEVAA